MSKLCIQPANALVCSASQETLAAILFQDKSVKCIYGGAFSGRDARLVQREEAVMHSFIPTSQSFQYLPSKSVAANSKRLHIEAAKVMTPIRDLISHDVDVHLQWYSSVLLDPKTLLRWNA